MGYGYGFPRFGRRAVGDDAPPALPAWPQVYGYTAPEDWMQERTGASATTVAGVGDPVGSLRNHGTLGGWSLAGADNNRAIHRVTAGGLHYLDMGAAVGGAALYDPVSSDIEAVFAAVQVDSLPAGYIGIAGSPAAGKVYLVLTNLLEATVYTGSVWAKSTAALTTGAPHVVGMAGDSAGGTFRIDGADRGTYPNAVPGGSSRIGGAPGTYYTGHIFALAMQSTIPVAGEAEPWLAAQSDAVLA